MVYGGDGLVEIGGFYLRGVEWEDERGFVFVLIKGRKVLIGREEGEWIKDGEYGRKGSIRGGIKNYEIIIVGVFEGY